MIDLRNEPRLEEYLSTFEETSKGGKPERSMVHDTTTAVVNMDAFVKSYVRELAAAQGVAHIDDPRSVDALYIDVAGNNTLIEFKSGRVHSTEVRDKVCHSILILGDIASFDVSASRQEIDFILVYDENAYPAAEHDTGTGDESYDANHRVQASQSRADIAAGVNRKAKVRRSFAELERSVAEKIKGYACRDALALTAEQLQDQFIGQRESYFDNR